MHCLIVKIHILKHATSNEIIGYSNLNKMSNAKTCFEIIENDKTDDSMCYKNMEGDIKRDTNERRVNCDTKQEKVVNKQILIV